MKKLLSLICAVMVVCLLGGCQQDTNAAKRSITMHDEDWLLRSFLHQQGSAIPSQ